jgi:hypothetical protein
MAVSFSPIGRTAPYIPVHDGLSLEEMKHILNTIAVAMGKDSEGHSADCTLVIDALHRLQHARSAAT